MTTILSMDITMPISKLEYNIIKIYDQEVGIGDIFKLLDKECIASINIEKIEYMRLEFITSNYSKEISVSWDPESNNFILNNIVENNMLYVSSEIGFTVLDRDMNPIQIFFESASTDTSLIVYKKLETLSEMVKNKQLVLIRVNDRNRLEKISIKSDMNCNDFFENQ